ncbi:MAG: sulfonate transport system substrate-binding protein [Alphaproteobacteria bacterium]|jgi:NitT/TauT family transport system substrate-binding protein|nr:sulfonate transport system substrate-binding protein [Alphaproteobacteria bacterium]
MKRSLCAILFAAAFAALTLPSAASAQEIRIARQFSMGYLQFNVMEHEKLLEKHAAALGLKDLKIVWATFNGPDAMNNALISDSVDIVAGGVPGLLTLWNRTHGTANEVKGISALSSQPFLLNTRSDNIKSIADLKDSDRIAVPAVKVSVQAVTLQMAAAKQFGRANFGKLDPLTVSMSPPDSTIALLSGSGEINNVFGVPPFQQQQLEKPGIRTILNSFDVMDGPHTFTVAWTSARFREKNPTLYKALVAALKEATDIVDKDRQRAAGYWIEDVKSKMPLEKVTAVISGPQVKWTMAPLATMKYATFMHSVGSLKEAPKSWKDLFFPEVHDLNGS